MKPPIAPLEWSEAVRVTGSVERDRFIESNVDLVRYVALRIAPRLPASVELDDLVHDGILGLLDAVNKFRPEKGVKFRTYAERRVHGAIVDGLRKKDWHPRALRRSRREMEATRMSLATQCGREPTEDELCSAMGIELQELQQLLRDVSVGPIVALEDLTEEVADRPQAVAPHAALERKEAAELLVEAISELPDRELKILELYYHERLTMKEVGAVLGVTESRVCQLHSQAAARLRETMRKRMTAQLVVAGEQP